MCAFRIFDVITMNALHSASLLAAVQMAPKDPILGVTETFNADKNPHKVNLGVGIYYDDSGKVPLLECVRRAEIGLAEKPAARSYLPIDGLPAYDRAVRELVFGADSVAVKENRVITVQALGGTGALKGTSALVSTPLALSGTVQNPSLYPSKAALAGAAAGTALLGPGLGTAAGMKAGRMAEKLFGGKPDGKKKKADPAKGQATKQAKDQAATDEKKQPSAVHTGR